MTFSAWAAVAFYIYDFYCLFLTIVSVLAMLGSQSWHPWVYFGIFVTGVPPLLLATIFGLAWTDARPSTLYSRAKWDYCSWAYSAVAAWVVTAWASISYLAMHGNKWMLGDTGFDGAHFIIFVAYTAMSWITFNEIYTYAFKAYEVQYRVIR